MSEEADFGAVLARYREQKAAEDAIPNVVWEADQDATAKAMAATEAAAAEVLVSPASSISELSAKLQVLQDVYGIQPAADRDVLAQIAAEATVLAMISAPDTIFLPVPGTQGGWAEAEAAYLTALRAEREYDAANVDPLMILDFGRPGGIDISAVPDEVWKVSEQLQDVRCAAEDVLMAIPSSSAEHLALKYLIARGGGREADCWDKMLEAEAQLFAPQWAGAAA